MTHQRVFVSYARTSTSKQKYTISPEQQQRAARAYGERQGWKHYGDVTENMSGRKYEKDGVMTRKGIELILDLIKTGKITDIVIDEVDRLSRDSELGKRFIKEVYNSHGKISFVDLGKTFNTYDECITDTYWLRAASEFAWIGIVTKGKKNKRLAIELGSFPVKPPLGFRNEKEFAPNTQARITRIKVHPYESQKVTLALEMYVSGKYSNSEIVRAINQRFPEGHTYNSNTLRLVLPNAPYYAGKKFPVKLDGLYDAPTIKEFDVPAFISEDLANQVLAKLASKSKSMKDKHDRPFYRVLFCSRCGKGTVFRKDTKTFKCNHAQYTMTRLQFGESVDKPTCTKTISYGVLSRMFGEFLGNGDAERLTGTLEQQIAKVVHRYKVNQAFIKSSEDLIQDKVREREQAITNFGTLSNVSAAVIAALSNFLQGMTDRIDAMSNNLDKARTEFLADRSTLESLGINAAELYTTELETDVERMRSTLIEMMSNLENSEEYERASREFDSQLVSEGIKVIASQRATRVKDLLGDIRAAFQAEDWITLSDLMLSVGLRIEVNTQRVHGLHG